MASIRFSLREHKLYAALNPVITFSKPSGSVVKVDSTLLSYGRGYAFITVPRAWLDGKYLRFLWKGSATDGHAVEFKVLIYDGSYDRSSDTDFPSGSEILSKGNGLLQTVVDPPSTFDWTTADVLIDVSGGSETNCTIFFQLTDAWGDWAVYMEIDWFEINSASGGSGNLYDEQFTDSVTMEVTGTYGDYGYISTGEVSEGEAHYKTVTELLGLTDTKSRVKGYKRTFIELLGLTDTRSRSKAIHRTKIELLGLFDTKSRVKTIYRTVFELLGLDDTILTVGKLLPAIEGGIMKLKKFIYPKKGYIKEDLEKKDKGYID